MAALCGRGFAVKIRELLLAGCGQWHPASQIAGHLWFDIEPQAAAKAYERRLGKERWAAESPSLEQDVIVRRGKVTKARELTVDLMRRGFRGQDYIEAKGPKNDKVYRIPSKWRFRAEAANASARKL